jgi:protein-disulfide isomerase
MAKGVESKPQPAPQAQAPQAPAVRKVEVPSDSPVFGPKNAKVTIVEFSDFQCPFCSRVVPTVQQIKQAYGKDVRIIFRNQPLPFHNNAKPAAQAALAAHAQGKFWEMHDKLFANQKALEQADLEKYAQELGLNMAKFKADMESDKVKAKIAADMAAGSSVGANGTPTFFINGRTLVGAQPFEAFKKVIDEELKKAGVAMAAEAK